MSWFNILKVDTRPDIRNEAQYNAASLEKRRLWHIRQSKGYRYRLNALRTQHTIDLTDTENPIYQEMKEYQDMRNFHGRQAQRLAKCIRSGRTECNDYYSPELEGDNRQKKKLMTTPTGKLDPYVELSLDAYNDLTNEQKIKYHAGLRSNGKNVVFHGRMFHRLTDTKAKLPTFPSPEHGGESTLNRKYTKEEYENLSNEEKKNYHGREKNRQRKLGNNEKAKFHRKMYERLKSNRNLPVYYSLEEEEPKVLPQTSKEEYLNLSDEDKIKFHARMEARAIKNSDKPLQQFHSRMRVRFKRKNLPTYYSPEHQQEEE